MKNDSDNATCTDLDGGALRGRCFIVTRASCQNEFLLDKIRSLGGRALAAPCVRIEFTGSVEQRRAFGLAMHWADSAIFTSANAVDAAWALSAGSIDCSHLKLWTAGSASRQRLLSLTGDGVSVCSPSVHQGARGLAQLPSLQELAGRRFVLVRGQTSLGNISPWLRERGAEVREFAIYKTHTLVPDFSRCLSGAGAHQVDGVFVSSLSALSGLNQAIKQSDWQDLPVKGLLVVASERIARQARLDGWSTVRAGDEPDDSSLIDCALASLK